LRLIHGGIDADRMLENSRASHPTHLPIGNNCNRCHGCAEPHRSVWAVCGITHRLDDCVPRVGRRTSPWRAWFARGSRSLPKWIPLRSHDRRLHERRDGQDALTKVVAWAHAPVRDEIERRTTCADRPFRAATVDDGGAAIGRYYRIKRKEGWWWRPRPTTG